MNETLKTDSLLESPRVKRIYLDELASNSSPSLSLSLVQLIITPEEIAINQAKKLVARTKQEISQRKLLNQIFDLIETIIVYKLPTMSREEIIQMLGFTEIDVKQTRFYQDVFAEGKEEGRQQGETALILRLLNRRLGQLEPSVVEKIHSLSIAQLEILAEILLDFSTLNELEIWLECQ